MQELCICADRQQFIDRVRAQHGRHRAVTIAVRSAKAAMKVEAMRAGQLYDDDWLTGVGA